MGQNWESKGREIIRIDYVRKNTFLIKGGQGSQTFVSSIESRIRPTQPQRGEKTQLPHASVKMEETVSTQDDWSLL